MSGNPIVDTRENKTDEAQFMAEIRENFDWAYTYDSTNRLAAEDDLENLNGNQWDAITLQQRKEDFRPSLTINKLPSFVDQVKGDARLNQMQIKVRANHPNSNDQKNNKPEELADVYNGLIRQIEQASKAGIARQTAFDGALQNGFGFYEIDSDFADDDTFDQEIRTRRIKNQFSCFVDPMHVEVDARDARYWFKTDMIRKKDFKAKYPKLEPSQFQQGYAGTPYQWWFDDDSVRVAVYWIKRPFKKRLVSLDNGETYSAVKWEKVQDELKAKERIVHVAMGPNGEKIPTPGPAPEGSGFEEAVINKAPEVVRERTVDSHVVVKYIVDGTQIIDGPKNDAGKFILEFTDEKDIRDKEGKFRKFVWPGKYIPIIPVWGKELQIGNQTFRRSLIRYSKDAQRMYNYERTAETERVALAQIPPAVLTKGQIAGFEDMWKSTKKLKYLLYNTDPAAKAPPYFPNPPQASSGNTMLSATATQDMKDTMSIQSASLGMQGNEKSGKAILARQRENDVANFEFTDNLVNAITLEADIYVDLIPHIYDTERQLLVLNEDGSDEFVTINQTVRDEDTGEDVVLNDLTQGKYLVTVTTGPNFTTQRIETAEALTSLAGSVQEPMAGLILLTKIVKNMDWPGATETAEMLEKMLPPQFRNLTDEEKAQLQAQEGQQKQPTIEQFMDAAKLQGHLLKNEETQLNIDEKEAKQGKNVQRLQATLDQLGPLLQQLQGGGGQQ